MFQNVDTKLLFTLRPIQTRVSVQLSKAPSGFVETSFYELARWLPHHNTVRNRGDTPSASEGWFLQLLGLALLKGDYNEKVQNINHHPKDPGISQDISMGSGMPQGEKFHIQ